MAVLLQQSFLLLSFLDDTSESALRTCYPRGKLSSALRLIDKQSSVSVSKELLFCAINDWLRNYHTDVPTPKLSKWDVKSKQSSPSPSFSDCWRCPLLLIWKLIQSFSLILRLLEMPSAPDLERQPNFPSYKYLSVVLLLCPSCHLLGSSWRALTCEPSSYPLLLEIRCGS